MIDEHKLVEDIEEFMFNIYGCDLENVSEFQRGNESKAAYIVQGLYDAVEFINEQPKVGEWIPVEERLPEEEGTYLCYEVCGNYPCYGVLNFAKNLHKVDKYDFQNEKRPGFYHLDSEYGYLEDTNVVAWMPLPAPYDMRKKVE